MSFGKTMYMKTKLWKTWKWGIHDIQVCTLQKTNYMVLCYKSDSYAGFSIYKMLSLQYKYNGYCKLCIYNTCACLLYV